MSLTRPTSFPYQQSVALRSGSVHVSNSTSHSPYHFPQQHLGDVPTETCGDKCVLIHTPYSAKTTFEAIVVPNERRLLENTQPLSAAAMSNLRKPKKRHKGGEDDSPRSSSSSSSGERFIHNPYCLDNVMTRADDIQLHTDAASEGSFEDHDTPNSSDPECEKPVEGAATRHLRGLSVVPPCGHPSDWKRLRFKKGLSHFVCTQCGLKWKSKGAMESSATAAPATTTATPTQTNSN
jgi:hypothetical protein